jgi:hypothetical protein
MQKQQLISIKNAATSTGISEETIRKYIRSGQITGEKKNYIFWDEWFVPHKDLAKIQEAESLKIVQGTLIEAGSVSNAPALASANLVGVGVTAATDNGIKSNVNYSWMPDTSHKFDGNNKLDISNKLDSGSSRTQGTSLPASLAAEIEKAFAPNTANEAFGARAYLEHSDEQTIDNDHIDGETEEDTFEQESRISKFSVGRSSGRRKRTEHYERQTEEQTTQQQEIQPQSIQPHSTQQAPWNDYRAIAKTVAEEFLAPLLSRLESQAALLHERDQLIAEQAAQLRLLPDFQRQSEEARNLAEQKQQEALLLKQSLSWERKKALIKISAWQMKHVKVERQLKSVEQQVFDIQDQKDSEVNYLHCQLSQLQEQLVKAHQPWWKKLFRS